MSAVKISLKKGDEDVWNSFAADEDKVGDKIEATLKISGKTFRGLGDTKAEAIADLRESVSGYYNAQKHIANIEIDKAEGICFFN